MNDIFKKLAKPFPESAYREVNLGRKFTTIDAYHVIERLTEVFGLCGEGWGYEIDRWEIHGDNVACIGRFFWLDPDGQKREIPHVGDARVIKGNIAEGYKKAITNMISKAASMVGVGLGVYQGKGMDDPYLDRESAQSTPKEVSKPRIVKMKAWMADNGFDDEEIIMESLRAIGVVEGRRIKYADLTEEHADAMAKNLKGFKENYASLLQSGL